jgi:quercetin dioxygenase-like cupin family protein
MTTSLSVTPWTSPEPVTEMAIRKILSAESLDPYSWSNGPGDVYSAHSHAYNKVIYVVRGSITFGLPDENRKITLNPGDRLDLPAGVVHDAIVGQSGVVCLEAHSSRHSP